MRVPNRSEGAERMQVIKRENTRGQWIPDYSENKKDRKEINQEKK